MSDDICLGRPYNFLDNEMAQRNGLAIFWTYSNNFHTKYALTCKISLYLTREPTLKTTLVEFVFKCSVEVHLRIDRPKCPKKRDVIVDSSNVVFDR